MDNTSLVETSQIDSKIQIILRQTDYTEEMAREKLTIFNFDEMEVIRDYLNISKKKESNKITSINQEIYKQMRCYLNGAMKNYHERVNKGETKKII
jgi:hypothetical protein